MDFIESCSGQKTNYISEIGNAMSEGIKSTIFWSWVGKVSTLITLFFLMVQGVQFFTVKEYDIVASGDYSLIAFPDSMNLEINNFIKSIEADSIKFLLPIPKDDRERHRIAQTIRAYLIKKISYTVKTTSILERPRSIWWFTIANRGKKEIADLNLELPFDGSYKIERAGELTSFADFRNNIKISSLRPSNEVVITVWTTQGTFFNSERTKTRITHPDGVIAIDYPEKTRGVIAFYVRWFGVNIFGHILFILIVLGLVLLCLKLVNILKKQPQKERFSKIPKTNVKKN